MFQVEALLQCRDNLDQTIIWQTDNLLRVAGLIVYQQKIETAFDYKMRISADIMRLFKDVSSSLNPS